MELELEGCHDAVVTDGRPRDVVAAGLDREREVVFAVDQRTPDRASSYPSSSGRSNLPRSRSSDDLKTVSSGWFGGAIVSTRVTSLI
jgi:hypothetical protein